MKRRITGILAAVCALVMLSSCGLIDTAKSNIDEIAARFRQDDKKEQPAAEQPAAVQIGAVPNSVTVGVTGIDTWNPLLTQSPTVKEAMEFVYDTLYEINENHETVPVLAREYSISPDGLTVSVSLKSDVIWHDGRRFDAYDVVYTSNLIMGGGTIYGDLLKDVRECKMRGSDTAVFSLNRSVPDFVSLLTYPIVQYKTDMSYTASIPPVGTGPYSFYGKIGTDRYMLIAADSYHNGRASIDGVYIVDVPDREKYKRLFEVGEIDLITDASVDIVNGMPRGYSNLNLYTSDRMTYLGFNTASAPVAGAATRRGISKLIDREDIVEGVLYSKAKPVRIPINPDSYLYYDTNGTFKATYEEAYADFEEDGWEGKEYGFQRNTPGGVQDLAVHLLVNSDNTVTVQTANRIKSSLDHFGVAVDIDAQPYDVYIWKVNAHDYDMFIGEADIGHNGDLSPLTGEWNYFSYSNPSMDTLIAQTGMTSDTEQKKQLYIQMGQLIEKDMPFAPLYFLDGCVLSGSRVKTGIAPTVSSYYRVANLWKVN